MNRLLVSSQFVWANRNNREMFISILKGLFLRRVEWWKVQVWRGGFSELQTFYYKKLNFSFYVPVIAWCGFVCSRFRWNMLCRARNRVTRKNGWNSPINKLGVVPWRWLKQQQRWYWFQMKGIQFPIKLHIFYNNSVKGKGKIRYSLLECPREPKTEKITIC